MTLREEFFKDYHEVCSSEKLDTTDAYTLWGAIWGLKKAAEMIDKRLIYTGPGGFDPEPIQKMLANNIMEEIEKLKQ